MALNTFTRSFSVTDDHTEAGHRSVSRAGSSKGTGLKSLDDTALPVSSAFIAAASTASPGRSLPRGLIAHSGDRVRSRRGGQTLHVEPHRKSCAVPRPRCDPTRQGAGARRITGAPLGKRHVDLYHRLGDALEIIIHKQCYDVSEWAANLRFAPSVSWRVDGCMQWSLGKLALTKGTVAAPVRP